ncbi:MULTISPECIES: AAA family ATPase [Klebsiella]|uniref:AAA family ATPase n=1 Tax=Klebsiella TaxID=570 RepID=UPI0018C78EBF|nr:MULTISPECIES: AAA family ATPase [Klebsiella]MBG2616661.1 AAA family ATPase [Klebsiella oxytoca]MCY0046505.1 AAA family ATPase [Klebsiella quasipneumoniae]HBM2889874.1 AAA family ATPase [Klebsiella oxytoca]
MKLTKLVLSNFRSFKDPQTIEFSPVTLLFGANSVGKTTILMAIFYLQHILDKGQCDPIHINAMGNRRVDGFKSLVYGGNLNNEITIGIEFEPEQMIGIEYSAYIEEVSELLNIQQLLAMKDISSEADCLYVELKIAWSFISSSAYVKQYNIFINNEILGTLQAEDSTTSAIISRINFDHPILIPENNELWEDLSGEKNISVSAFQDVLDNLVLSDNSVFMFEGPLRPCEIRYHTDIVIKGCIGALPILGEKIKTNLKTFDLTEQVHYFNREIVEKALTQIFTSPLDKICSYLKNSISIGPIRTIPDSSFIPNPYPEQSGWFDGTSAWDKIYTFDIEELNNNGLINKVSKWFSSPDKLNSGYEIINSFSINRTRKKSEINNISPLPDQNRVLFGKVNSDLRLFPNQVGVGLTQIMPVVVASYSVTNGIICIEQPELHIHPAFQVSIGDLFTQLEMADSKKPMFLIETHSEHIILRILKRIRQSSLGQIPDGMKPVLPNDISIINLQSSPEGIIVKKQLITDDGDFLEEWPNGFFDERDEELF